MGVGVDDAYETIHPISNQFGEVNFQMKTWWKQPVDTHAWYACEAQVAEDLLNRINDRFVDDTQWQLRDIWFRYHGIRTSKVQR